MCNFDIAREKWITYFQAVEILIIQRIQTQCLHCLSITLFWGGLQTKMD